MQGHYVIWQLTFLLYLASKIWRDNVRKVWDLKKKLFAFYLDWKNMWITTDNFLINFYFLKLTSSLTGREWGAGSQV